MVNITSWTELNNVRDNPNYYDYGFTIALKTNLKTTDSDYSGIGNSWSPLPTLYGIFDGGGHYIEGLSAPLFNDLYGGQVCLVGIKNANINTSYAGAIAGGSMYGYIHDCWSTGTIVGSSSAGGILSSSYYGNTISNCWSSASVSGEIVGGLFGSGDCSISNCFAVGNVSGSTVGGLIGQVNGSIDNCGWITSKASNAIADLNGSGPSNVAYNETSISPYYDSSHGVYSGWDFSSVWHTNSSELPTLIPIGETPTTPVTIVKSSSSSSVVLNWTESTSIGGEIIGYKIERRLYPSETSFTTIEDNTGLVLTFTDNTVSTDNIYIYRVTALSYGESSAASSPVMTKAKQSSFNILSDGIEIPLVNYQYFGNKNEDGSYRIFNNSGVYTVQKRVSGNWISYATLSGTNTGDQDLSGLMPKSGGTFTGSIYMGDKIIYSTGSNSMLQASGGAVLVGGDETGLELHSSSRPVVYEGEEEESLAYLSDIPDLSSYATKTYVDTSIQTAILDSWAGSY